MNCTDCKNAGKQVCTVCCAYQGGPDKWEPKPETNADRIRSMTDEELADWVWGAETAGRAYGSRGKKAWLDWLRQAATE